MHQEQVDTEASDFNGAAWRRKWGKDQRRDSTIEEAFANTIVPIPLGSTPLLGPGGVPGEWADVCGFIKPVKETEHLRVQELVKGIENHPHREALHADLQQNNVYNLFSNNSQAMIRELGNVELFELCETFPKVSSLLESRICVLHLRTMLD